MAADHYPESSREINSANKGSKTGSIAIIDNDAKFRRTLLDILRLNGFQAVDFGSGLEGMRYIISNRPEVALIDIRMDDISGIEIIRRVKSASAPTECIVITGYSSQTGAIEAINVGAYQYMQKPFNMEQLLLTCRRALEKKGVEDALLKSMERYRSLVENAQEGIFQIAPDGTCIMANQAMAAIAGYASPGDMMEKLQGGLSGLFDNPSTGDDFVVALNKEGTVRGLETTISPKVGPAKFISIYARNVTGPQGEMLYQEGLVEDITSRKKAEQELIDTLFKLRRSVDGAIQAMAQVVEIRDPYTAGHQKKVANLARAISQEMKLSQAATDGIRMAAAIHDIGKVAVPAELLSKPNRLSDLEMQLIRIHPDAGWDILKGIDFPWPVAEIVRQHHEKIDGSGYPRGLGGDDILIEAKILAVADVVEAMSSHRPYRPALGLEKGLEEITLNQGTLYDGETVQACLRLFRERDFQLE